MSILKMKIARAKEFSLQKKKTTKQHQKPKSKPRSPQSTPSVIASPSSDTTSANTPGSTSYKNIVKNYSKALTKFAASKLATPFLIPILHKYSVNLEDFREFILARRNKVNCIKTLREMLLAQESDGKKISTMKLVFQEISVVFMKQFSVNWIFNSKISNKRVHLNARFKVLRRIQNPLYFTYLEEFSKKSSEKNGYKMKF